MCINFGDLQVIKLFHLIRTKILVIIQFNYNIISASVKITSKHNMHVLKASTIQNIILLLYIHSYVRIYTSYSL